MLKGRKLWFLFAALVVLGVAGVFLARTQQQRTQAAAPQYETEPVRRGDVTATIGASGQVNAGQSATLAWQTSGKVAAVAAQPGQRVQAGDILASLEPTSLPATVAQAESDLLNAQGKLEKLKNSNAPLGQARLALIKAEKTLRDAQDAREALDEPRATRTNIEAAEAAVSQANATLKAAEEAYQLVEGLAEDDPTRLRLSAQVVSARRQKQNAEWNLAYVHSTPAPGEYERVDAALAVAQAGLEDARREVERQKQSANIETTRLEIQIEAAQAVLGRQHLAAPFSGSITEVHAQVNDVVKQGSPAFRLDDLEDMDVVVQVPEVDISRVKVEQAASLAFDAVPGRTYSGTVQTVARAGDTVQGVVRFYVRIHANDLDEAVRPGMTAAVTIAVASARDALIVPNRAIRMVNGRMGVYVLKGDQPELVEITIGINGDTESEVVSGLLKEGQSVILNPPSGTGS